MTNADIQRGIDAIPEVKEIIERHAREIPKNVEPMLLIALNSRIIPWHNDQCDLEDQVENTHHNCQRLAQPFLKS